VLAHTHPGEPGLAHYPPGEGGRVTVFMEIPDVPRGHICALPALDAAGTERQSTLVTGHEAELAALAPGLGCPPQQAAVAAPLQTAETQVRANRWLSGVPPRASGTPL
jgi:hypothetical protein